MILFNSHFSSTKISFKQRKSKLFLETFTTIKLPLKLIESFFASFDHLKVNIIILTRIKKEIGINI